ncbi:MAG: hypothetical protein ABI645_12760 [Pseudomonadota bacterium]
MRGSCSSNPSQSNYLGAGGFGLANFCIGFRSGSTWDVYAWMRNAFDKKYFRELKVASGGNTGRVGIPVDPRIWELTVRAGWRWQGS